MLKHIGCGGCRTVSSPIVPQPPHRSPLNLLPSPCRIRAAGVSSSHYRAEVGELPSTPSAVASSLRTRDPRHVASMCHGCNACNMLGVTLEYIIVRIVLVYSLHSTKENVGLHYILQYLFRYTPKEIQFAKFRESSGEISLRT